MDWNEDGLKDLIVGENNGQVRYFRNIGTAGNPVLTYEGTLMVGGSAIDIGDYSHPFVDDWNEDGMKDLQVGASDGRVWLYINEGTNANPVFNTTQYVTLATGAQVDFGSRSGPNVVDMNGDGVKDLVSGNIDGKIYYCQNNGTNANPQLAYQVALMSGSLQINPGGTSRTAPIDWDNNGSPDLVAGSYDARLKRYMQVATTPPAPTCDLTLIGSYIIPASGGTLTFTFMGSNQSGSTVIFDAWTEVQMPDDSWYGPLITREDLSLGPYSSMSPTVNQNVPAGAPYGYYYYYGYVGDYSALQVYSQDYIFFYKTGDDDGGTWIGDWNCSGWEEEAFNQPEIVLPDRLQLSASPNPFNPITTLNFDLPEAAMVEMSVYNAAGRKIATLVNGYRDAGRHEVTWDAGTLPSGIYFAQIQAGTHRTVRKLLLTK